MGIGLLVGLGTCLTENYAKNDSNTLSVQQSPHLRPNIRIFVATLKQLSLNLKLKLDPVQSVYGQMPGVLLPEEAQQDPSITMSRKSPVPPSVRCGIDTGGTFTDLIGVDDVTGDLVIGKFPFVRQRFRQVPSRGHKRIRARDRTHFLYCVGNHTRPQRASAAQGRASDLRDHAGFEDVLFIQRMNRRHHYSFEWKKPEPLVKTLDCLGIQERIDAHGRVHVPLSSEKMDLLATSIEDRLQESPGQDVSIAICLLFSYLNPSMSGSEEISGISIPGIPLSISHEVAPIWREYERGSTTVIDAFIKPILIRYVASVRASLEAAWTAQPWTIMKSNGGMRPRRQWNANR